MEKVLLGSNWSLCRPFLNQRIRCSELPWVKESGTTRLVDSGVHEIGKKVVEEAAEVWMAAEHEGPERAAEEISQLLYHIQCMMLASKVSLEDVYRRL